MKHIFNNRRSASKEAGQNNNRGSWFVNIKRFDMLAKPIPTFNVKGEETIKTNLGAFMSMVIAITVMYYSALKFVQLYTRHNPAISTYPIDRVYDIENPTNLNASNLMPAFKFSG